MSMLEKKPIATLAVLVTTLLGAAELGCKSKPAPVDGHGTAAEWNGWSQRERSTYIEGYTGGYGEGFTAACDKADKLPGFEAKPPWFDKDGVPNDPVNQCQKAISSFTRGTRPGNNSQDFSAYTGVITEFYAKYPKYSHVPFGWLMTLLSDQNYTTADQLFQKLQQHDMQWTY